MGGDLGESTYGKRWVLFATFYNVQIYTNTLRDGQAEPKGSVAGSSGACAPKPATEPRSFNEEWLFRLVNYEVLDRENVKSFGLAAF